MSCGRPYPAPPEGLPYVNIDLDGTLADGNDVWPSPRIGDLLSDGRRMVQHYFDKGCEVRVFTSRPASHRPRIEAWLRKHGLDHMVYDVICDKPLGLLIDDRAANPLLWRMIFDE